MTSARRIPAAVAAAVVAAIATAALMQGLRPLGATTQVRNQFSVFEPEAAPWSTLIDQGRTGFDPGDTILENKPLYNRSSGAKVGTTVTRIAVVRTLAGGDLLFFIDCTVTLGTGHILFSGAGKFSQVATGVGVPVTGGTGSYSRSAGVVVIKAGTLNGKPGVNLEFDIVTP